jgi:anti-sigma factor RsiW
MNCEDLLRQLTEYSDGVLDKPLCAEIERHLRDCPSCAELRHDLEDLARLCHECDAPKLPDDVRKRIEARLRA